MRAAAPEAISPTAHYTGYVWARNGLSHPLLATNRGRLFYESFRPAMLISGLLGGPTLEPYLLTRHRAIDAQLDALIEHQGVRQVIELACGLSPRGWRFTERYGERLTYVEADLPAMAARKSDVLQALGSLTAHHRVVSIDVLRHEGPLSLSALIDTLATDTPTAIVVEGLVGYLETEVLESLWRYLAEQLSRFAGGFYISDLHLSGEAGLAVHAFRLFLSAFVGGRVALHHYQDESAAESALRAAGFSEATVRSAAELAWPDRPEADDGALLAHIAQARTA